MATTAQISSSFEISVTLDGAAAHTVTPGRAGRIVKIVAFNGAGTPNITVTDGSNNIAATQATLTSAGKVLGLTEANCEITASESLVITNANASTNKVIITMVATGGGQAITVS